MSFPLIVAIVTAMLATTFLSGIFGMAGGMILLGILLLVLPVPDAMALHAVTQIASNGWRGVLWLRYVHWRAAGYFLTGCVIAFGLWAIWRYVPPKALTLILLGCAPFVVRLLPRRIKPDPERPVHGILVGGASMMLMLLSGVSGPLIDTFFLSGGFQRRQVVATKAICQTCCHTAKLIYFGGIVDQAATIDPTLACLAIVASVIGTTLARPVLEKLTDTQYRVWANRIITTIACVYIAQGVYQLTFTAP